MTTPYASSSLLVLLLLWGCSNPAEPPPAASTTPGIRGVAASTAAKGEASSEGGGGLSGGDGDRSEGASQPSRAERDQAYQQAREGFPQESSRAPNPSQARRQASPKTLEQTAPMSGRDEVLAMTVTASSLESVQSGKELYASSCAACHKIDGSPERGTGNLAAYNMANLSDPLRYKYGADARGVFRSIAFGVPAPPHGIYKKRLSDAQIWNLTNFVLSLQKPAES